MESLMRPGLLFIAGLALSVGGILMPYALMGPTERAMTESIAYPLPLAISGAALIIAAAILNRSSRS